MDEVLPQDAAFEDLRRILNDETDPARRAEMVEEFVLECCGVNERGEPLRNPAYLQSVVLHAYAALMSIDIRAWVLPASRLLIKCRERLLTRQRSEGVRFDTGYLSQLLTEAHANEDNVGAAHRWALLTQAADLLANHPDGGGLGRVWLYGLLGVEAYHREALDQIAREGAGVAEWRTSRGFPEDCVRRLLRNRPCGSELFSRAMLKSEFPICKPYLQALWEETNADGLDTDTRGKRFESLAEYLLSLLPGCVPMTNVVDLAGASQHDVVVANHSTSPDFPTEVFGAYFIAECKNWAGAVGAPDIGYFLFRLRQAKCRFGVLFSRAGITGTQESEEFARALIARSFRGDDVSCVVINHQHIVDLIEGRRTSFMAILRSELEELRYGRPRP